ncbi:P-loop containing nucleoside triphosphate hydrolase protein [Vararia minispora EC-137]|uniref:P-loop containing nucleoside triphosphate hydrolase protein n=1 Tax=Vararia minispora EC-137 TaxID=1314806 RepID=A0ACB8Q5T6_9AGAM|nr:P-loop containing nucleoside triphosphate hydrolase protein [Vararia minispora EC-137]
MSKEGGRLTADWEGASSHAKFLASAESPGSIPALKGLPEVIVIGRSNVGKSSLINAVLCKKQLAYSSKHAGRTKALNFYSVGFPPYGKFVLVDAPGYGRMSRQEWGALFDHYVETREQLRRVYTLINFGHGMLESDRLMLEMLNEKILSGNVRWTLQAIITQLDRAPPSAFKNVAQLKEELLKVAPTCLPPIFTAAVKPKMGIEGVRGSMLEACSLPSLSL